MEVVIVGLGSIAAKHVQALKITCPEAKIFALRSSQNSVAVPGVINVYNFDEVQHVDFAIICNPTNLHYNTIKQFAVFNIPMMIEKPPLRIIQNVDALLADINKNNLFTYVACNLRFHPCIQFLKDYIIKENPFINELNVYCGSYLPDWRPGKDFRNIYSARPEMGGGVHLDLFHELDYVTWIFGNPDKTHCVKRNVSSLSIQAYDYANFVLQYKSYTANIILNYYRRVAKRQIEIVFTDDIWTVDLLLNQVTNSHGTVVFSVINYNIIDTYIEQMQYFLKMLKSGLNPMNTLSESLNILKIALTDEF